MAQRLRSFWQDETGATSVEYALIGVVVGVAALGGLQLIRNALNGFFSDATASFSQP